MAGDAHQLPRGRHGLTREQVLASQRGRMLAAVAAAVAERGFARTAVADVIRRAGVSRETFYEQFTDKEDCFLAALDAGVGRLLDRLTPELSHHGDGPRERFDRILGAYLDQLVAEPTFAKAYLIDAYGAGVRVTTRRIELQQRFIELIAGVLGPAGSPTAADRFAGEALVAAVSSLVTARVGSGRIDELPALHAPLLEVAGRLFPAFVGASDVTLERRAS